MMIEEAFSSNSGCGNSSHTQHLCCMFSEGVNLSNETEYRALVENPQFKCQKCGRLAKSGINLCKPLNISYNRTSDREELKGRMRKYKSVDELLDTVIIRVTQTSELYIKMAFMGKNPWMCNVLEGFAQDELQHREKLEAVKAGRIGLEQKEIGDIGVYDVLEDIKPDPNMDYLELLAYAIKKEDSAHRFYNSMVSIFSEPDLKDIFLELAQEEVNHKRQLEIEYDFMTF